MDWTGEQRRPSTRSAVGWRPASRRSFACSAMPASARRRSPAMSRKARKGEAAFAAFTGKAALVMRSKGCAGATTIHALIYRAVDDDDGAPNFKLNHDGPASRAGLIVIDECSMVDAELGRDLLSFGKPILVLGDPAQLPPVKGGGFFTDAEPDVMLTRDPSAGEGRSDHPHVRRSARRRQARLWRLWRELRDPPRRRRRPRPSLPPIRCWSASTGHGVSTTSASAISQGSRAAAGGRRQIGLPAQRSRQRPDQRRPVARRDVAGPCARISCA